MNSLKEELLSRFIRYVKIDTQSETDSNSFPSTKKQFDLANLLVDELKAMGLEDAKVDDKCYVTATLESNIEDRDSSIPVLGFIAHMDTAPNESGKDVKPQIYHNYDGGVIYYPGNSGIKLSPEDNPYLKKCIGDTIITSDGTTLLGADDKAGIANIITAISYLLKHPEIGHGRIRVCFTPDEEVGQGTKYFDIENFGADFAFTVDGHMPGEINKETFYAEKVKIIIKGKDIHPGEAKDVMVNSIRAASEIVAKLPKDIAPESTWGYEPFIHPYEFNGTVSKSSITMILRSFNNKDLEKFNSLIMEIVSSVKNIYTQIDISVNNQKQYSNMLEYLEKKEDILDILWDSIVESGVEPIWKPIRGGTDGALLSERGLPTPNIFAGYENAHSKKEYASLNSMLQSVKVLINITKNVVKRYTQ